MERQTLRIIPYKTNRNDHDWAVVDTTHLGEDWIEGLQTTDAIETFETREDGVEFVNQLGSINASVYLYSKTGRIDDLYELES